MTRKENADEAEEIMKWVFESLIVLEPKGSGTGLLQQLAVEGFHAIAYNPEGSKKDRMVAQSAVIESGKVFLPHKAPWEDIFRTEIVSFPHGKHDDQIDDLSQILDWLQPNFVSILDVL